MFLIFLGGLHYTLNAAPTTSITISESPAEHVAETTERSPAIEWEPLLKVNYFGRASYLAILTPYYLLLGWLVWRYRVILKFSNWWFYVRAAALVMMVLGFVLEWLADVFFVWTFPPGRDFFHMKVSVLGWVFGHEVPVCELLWIVGVVPLFYYLWFWATLVFHDVIYVVDESGKFYKKEERWVGFHPPTRILTRLKNHRGQENEHPLFERPPGFIARRLERYRHVQKT